MNTSCVVASAAILAASLVGCGDTSDPGTTLSPGTPTPTSAVTTTTQLTPSPSPTPRPTPTPGKQDVYVVLRMDDFAATAKTQQQEDAINWAIENKVAFNFGIVTSDWPSDCLTGGTHATCKSKSVQAVNKAYNDGHILGTSDDAFLEICDHSHDHSNWAANFKKRSFVTNDFQKSGPLLETAYPKASIRTFIAPECLADETALDVMLDHKYDIMSAQGQLGCNESEGRAPQYNYLFAPCEDGSGRGGSCIPPNDIYFTEAGMQKMDNGIISLPTGSANSHVANCDHGKSVDVTIGLGDCGCHGDEKCPMLPNAYQNSRKSNGLWWTVLMMHPQTDFKACCGQTYKEWLDEFITKVRALKDYEVHFVTFQGLAELTAPQGTDNMYTSVV